MPDEFGEKTEQPTERRRTEARQKGNVARSVDLSTAGSMLAAAIALQVFAVPVTRTLAELLHTQLRAAHFVALDRPLVVRHFRDIGLLLSGAVLPVLLSMAAASLLFNIVQVGFLVAPEVLQPKFSRLNPLEGAKRLISIQALVKLGVSLGKLGIVATVAILFIANELPALTSLADAEPARILLAIRDEVVLLAFLLAIALIALALLDFGFQRWKHEQDLKMSKQEVREEMKQMEGDPHIRQRRREAHRKLSQAREMQAVKTADVVITNPTHIAVAIKYDPERMPAPMVVAKGMGDLAERIRRIAVEHRVPVIERKPLARALYRDVKVGHVIPVEMYEVFVEIMAYVYKLTERTPPNLD